MKTDIQNNAHNREQAIIFRGKSGLLQLKRIVENLFDSQIKRHIFGDKLEDIKHKPRRILQAVSNKIPVIVSNACGLRI
jgi:dsRNA-specific ribonuclease